MGNFRWVFQSIIVVLNLLVKPVLHIQSLKITRGERELSAIPQLDLEKGKTYGIIGESGSGKSLFLLSLMGLLSKELQVTGNILFESESDTISLLGAKPEVLRKLWGKSLGMVFQEPLSALNPQRKCGWQLMEALTVHQKINRVNGKEQCLKALADVGIEHPERIFDAYPHQISGGQRQRVMIAMATIHKPALVLADEPTTALDPETAEKVLEILVHVCRSIGSSLILVSHDLPLVTKHCEHITVMQHGKVVVSGKAGEVLGKEQMHPYVKALMDAMPTGKRDAMPEGTEIFTAEKLAKTYRKDKNEFKALQNISFKLKKGDALAVIGFSGSGKTTLAKILTGLETADEGSVIFNGESLLDKKPTGVQMVFQDPFSSLNSEINNRETLLEVLRLKGADNETAHNKSAKLFKQVGLDESLLDRFPHQLSGGQRQRLCIARALAGSPQVLVLDEAVAALDPLVQKQILDLLKSIQEQTGVIYLFITHNQEAAKYLCHRFIKLEHGNCVSEGKYN
ncbi:MAG: hypothetical protein RLZZ161_358 [Bacteroidota bacterium]